MTTKRLAGEFSGVATGRVDSAIAVARMVKVQVQVQVQDRNVVVSQQCQIAPERGGTLDSGQFSPVPRAQSPVPTAVSASVSSMVCPVSTDNNGFLVK
ncbi:hypothetical protein AXG93_4461s1220 [Marchantia polymorpha subsp. ruderalis]|uniref:Uncharacterized protein n=1 Tax=Marchantia polymorpha subsp. ruderalis TaxID=1480154 RepID=A0A176WRH7_MARPO|nr:hypothetical protein AXG93_4461s1220 [Marchantia polymorpha subsp. ruderalis]